MGKTSFLLGKKIENAAKQAAGPEGSYGRIGEMEQNWRDGLGQGKYQSSIIINVRVEVRLIMGE